VPIIFHDEVISMNRLSIMLCAAALAVSAPAHAADAVCGTLESVGSVHI
jgi:hypothetical protein